MIALTNTWRGFSPDKRWMISKLCLTIRTVMSFLPLLRPCIMSEFTNLSTIGHKAFLNRFAAYRPAEWGKYFADFLHGNVILKGHVRHINLFACPFVKKFGHYIGYFGASNGYGSSFFIPIISHGDICF